MAQSPYNLVNSGESDPIRSVKNSLETGKQGRLTFVQNGNQIHSVYKDPLFNAVDPNISNGLRKTRFMYITLAPTEYVDEVWVFDNIVPVWLSKETFRFYEKPLPIGGLSSPIPLDTSKYNVSKSIMELDFD